MHVTALAVAAVVLASFASGGIAQPMAASTPVLSRAKQSPYGRYVGDVVARWNLDNRTMTLERDFAFIDPLGVRWNAPKGSVVDGASIPQWAWSLIGGPFEGPYRPASVIHDVACAEKKAPWESVHLTFYYAMLASGVSERLAKIMYGAVYMQGPRWALTVHAKASTPDELLVLSRVVDARSESDDHVMVDVAFKDMNSVRTQHQTYEARAGDVVDLLEQGKAFPKNSGFSSVDSIKVIAIDRGHLDDAGLKKLKEYIEMLNPTLEQIRAFRP